METICKCCGEKIKFKLEDVIGGHRALCGDSKIAENYVWLMGDKKAKIIFSSPPYNGNNKLYDFYEDNLESSEFVKLNLDVLKNCIKYLSGFAFWNLSYNCNSRWQFLEIVYRIIKELKLEFLELIVWSKKTSLPITSKTALTRKYEDIFLFGDEESIKQDLEFYCLSRNDRGAWFNKKNQKGISNFWELRPSGIQTETHQACYPPELVIKGLELMSNRGDICLDPFLGLFTNIISANMCGRWGYGLELSEVYFSAGLNRWKKMTGRDPIKVGNITEMEKKKKR